MVLPNIGVGKAFGQGIERVIGNMEIRVPRIVGAFAAGRIMNTRTARSQYMGAMIWGISSALHEATEVDGRTARYTNDNLADYLIPVNADIEQLEVILVPRPTQWHQVNP
jgi:xanthine dehydrogenase YagR molybdenum-binding subunit